MGGDTARLGFRYQDLYLLRRILGAMAEHAETGVRPDVTFGIEGKASPDLQGDSPVWDVVLRLPTETEVAEVKSGAMSKAERSVFWERLRKEAGRTPVKRIIPKLVCDPGKIGNIDPWTGLATAVSTRSKRIPPKPKGNVTTSNRLCDEALWFLTRRKAKEPLSALTPTAAIALMRKFVVERCPADLLENQVEDGIELLLPDGLTDITRKLIQGWLTDRAVAVNHQLRFFTAEEIVEAVGIRNECLALGPGVLAHWKTLWADLPRDFYARTRLNLGNAGPVVDIADGHPTCVDAFTKFHAGGRLLLGKGGGGKSGLAAQISKCMANEDVEVFVAAADSIKESEVSSLSQSLRFKKALQRFRRTDSHFVLIVDGLDETESGLRQEWSRTLNRLAGLAGMSVIITMREGVWNSDKHTQSQLKAWTQVVVNDWPEDMVVELVAEAAPKARLSVGLKTLLRQPLMLDIYWRTFIETRDPSKHEVSLTTRYQLLRAFWNERFVTSPRHALELSRERLNSILEQAAHSLEPFTVSDMDTSGIVALVSESVVMDERHLAHKFRFRHLLLRDFALAFWCLGGSDASQVISRWTSITGGLRQHGALRAMLEAISDSMFVEDFPHLQWREILEQIVVDANGRAQLAQVLALVRPEPAYDPARWPESVQSALPSSFGADLIASAALHQNSSWAEAINNWDVTVPWIDTPFALELLKYTEIIQQFSLTARNRVEAQRHATLAAQKLRDLSEHPKFEAAFAENDRYLMMNALIDVIPLVPDQLTLEWVEREMKRASWRTRSFALDKLIYLASVDPDRTAAIYCSAVGLSNDGGTWVISPSIDLRTMDHHAIDRSLGGENPQQSLVSAYPSTFLPVAVHLAEATTQYTAIEFKGLVDDATYFWMLDGHDFSHRCVRVVKKYSLSLAESDLDAFLTTVYPILIKSKLLSLQSVLLDVLIKHVSVPRIAVAMADRLNDTRLFHFSTLGYWVQQGLKKAWAHLSQVEKQAVLTAIEGIQAEASYGRERCGRYLAVIPLDEMPATLRELAEEQLNEPVHLYPHPGQRDLFDDSLLPPTDDPIDDLTQGWPPAFSSDDLNTIARVSLNLSRPNTPPDELKQILQKTDAAIRACIPAFREHPPELLKPEHLWVWDRLEAVLARHAVESPDLTPPADLISFCAETSLQVLETEPYLVGDNVMEERFLPDSNSPWLRALSLANYALSLEPAKSDLRLEERIMAVFRTAFSSGDEFVQAAIGQTVDKFHWLLNSRRAALYEELFWSVPRSSWVLNSCFSPMLRLSDIMRARIFRAALRRAPMGDSDEYVGQLGKALGLAAFMQIRDLNRPHVTSLVREVVGQPDRLALLAAPGHRMKFLVEMAKGMSEQLNAVGLKVDLAPDYSAWMLRIWRHLRPLRSGKHQSEAVVFSALHLLEEKLKRNKSEAGFSILKQWWTHLYPLAQAVVSEGSRPDCFTLFFQLRDGDLNPLMSPQDLLTIGETLVKRLKLGVLNGTVILDERNPALEDFSPWEEILGHVAASLDSLGKQGLLSNDIAREKCRKLLAELSSSPFNTDAGRRALHRLQIEGT